MALALVNDPCISILICIVGLIISIHVLLLMITRVCYEALDAVITDTVSHRAREIGTGVTVRV